MSFMCCSKGWSPNFHRAFEISVMFLQQYLNDCLESFRKMQNTVKNAKRLYPSARGRKKVQEEA